MRRIGRTTISLGAASAALLIGGFAAAPTAAAGGGYEGVSASTYELCSARLDAAVDEARASGQTIDGIADCEYYSTYRDWYGEVWW